MKHRESFVSRNASMLAFGIVVCLRDFGQYARGVFLVEWWECFYPLLAAAVVIAWSEMRSRR